MTVASVIESLGVLFLMVAAAYAIWQWGPGLRKRTVQCPVRQQRAEVLAEQLEAEFGNLKTTDIKSCSLLKGSPVDCGKDCLQSL